MSYKVRTRDEHFANDGQPKRILALDGGGLRGIVTLSYLAEIEALLKERHGGDAKFRLSHFFDLIAGTSTGSIIAAALAKSMTVAEITEKYLSLGKNVFERSWFRQGLIRAKYDKDALVKELKNVFGETTTMGDPSLQTGLLIVTKRINTGSPWPIGNNPRGKYYNASHGSTTIANSAYPLWKVVRASTAAPTYFDPEDIEITNAQSGKDAVSGQFVDGGVSPFNNPALQALMYATLEGYRVGWPTGANKLLLVSVGTGSRDPKVSPSWITAKEGINSVISIMDDCASLMETLLQWISTSPTARVIDREIGDLRNDLLAPAPTMTYLRYNVELTEPVLTNLGVTLSRDKLESLSAMDDPGNMETLRNIGALAAKRQVHGLDFSSHFDLSD